MELFRSRCACYILAFIIIVIDACTKAYIATLADSVPSRLPVTVFSDFFGIQMQITHAINMGAAWGVLADFPNALVVVRLLLIGALVVYFAGVNKRQEWNIPLTLIISGAIGNVIDYFHYGYVIDMFQFCFWGFEYPVFNVADSCIFIGSIWILLSATMEKSPT